MAYRSQRLRDFMADQERRDAESPDERDPRTDGSHAAARNLVERAATAFDGLTGDFGEQGRRAEARFG